MTSPRPLMAETLRALPRALLLAAALAGPVAAMQSVQAGSSVTIEDSRPMSNGAGLVLQVSLQRA